MSSDKKKFLIVYDYYEPYMKAVHSNDTRAYESFLDLFVYLCNKDIEVFVLRDLNNCFPNNRYLSQYKFIPEKRDFEMKEEMIEPDCIWDKTSSLNFPNPFADQNVINSLEFKVIESNKWTQSQIFKEYFCQNILCNDLLMFNKYISQIKTEKIVIKPLSEYGGKGITFLVKEEVLKDTFDKTNLPELPFLIQSFTDTSKGVPGICESIHDLRFVYLNKQLSLCILRQPVNGQFLANYAQGGSFDKVELDKIPKYILDYLKPLSEQIIETYSNPYFSIDIGVEAERPVVFELTGAKVSFPCNDWSNEYFYEQFYQHILSKIA